MDSQIIVVISLGLALAALSFAIVMQFVREDRAHEAQLAESRTTNELLRMLVAAHTTEGEADAAHQSQWVPVFSPIAAPVKVSSIPPPREPMDTDPSGPSEEITKLSAQYDVSAAPPLLWEDDNETVVMHKVGEPCGRRG